MYIYIYISGWWFGTWILFFISYMGCHPSNWLSYLLKMVVVQINIISVIRGFKDIPLEIGRFSPEPGRCRWSRLCRPCSPARGPAGKWKARKSGKGHVFRVNLNYFFAASDRYIYIYIRVCVCAVYGVYIYILCFSLMLLLSLLLFFITIIDALSSNHFQTPTLICWF